MCSSDLAERMGVVVIAAEAAPALRLTAARIADSWMCRSVATVNVGMGLPKIALRRAWMNVRKGLQVNQDRVCRRAAPVRPWHPEEAIGRDQA